MTYAEFVKAIKSTVFPDREAQNLAAIHTKYILDGLIEIQKRVPELRDCNISRYPFEDTFYNCKATTILKPDGPVMRLYTTTQKDHCDRVYYSPTTREHMEALLEQAQSCGWYWPFAASGAASSTAYKNGSPMLASTEVAIARIVVDPPVIQGGRPGVWTVDLTAPAPAGGVAVTLYTTPEGIVTGIPPVLIVPEGEKSASVSFDTVLVEVATLVDFGVVLGNASRFIRIAILAWDSTDKGWRSCYGHYAVICDQLYLCPNIESNESLSIEWQGIKTSYNPDDEVDFQRDVQSVLELYVQSQTALREECDASRYATLQTFLNNEMAKLTWWYRKKSLLPEEAWRQIMCKTCEPVSTETTSGGGPGPGPPGPGPGPTTFTVYVGNGGEDFGKTSYTEQELTNLENGLPNSVTKSILAGEYEITRPASETNEFRVISFPQSVHGGDVEFKNSGFPFPMAELSTTNVAGSVYRVFRTTTPMSGDMTSAMHNPIVLIPK